VSWDLLTLVIKEGRSVPCVVLGDAHLREFFHVRTSLDPQRNGHISPFLLGINLMLCAWVDCSEKHSECLRLGGLRLTALGPWWKITSAISFPLESIVAVRASPVWAAIQMGLLRVLCG
jgi:hypothetical protein